MVTLLMSVDLDIALDLVIVVLMDTTIHAIHMDIKLSNADLK